MRTIATLAMLCLCFSAQAQFKKSPKKDSIKVVRSDTTIRPNALQLQDLNARQQQIQQLQAEFEYHLLLVFGMRKEDIESYEFKDGVFIVTKKKKQ